MIITKVWNFVIFIVFVCHVIIAYRLNYGSAYHLQYRYQHVDQCVFMQYSIN